MTDNTALKYENTTRPSDIIFIHKSQLKPDPNQPRKFFAQEVIEQRRIQLEENGQDTPITVLSPIEENGKTIYRIVDGECRWRAAMQSDRIDTLRAEIYTKSPTRSNVILSQLLHNDDGTAPLTILERAAAYQNLVKELEGEGIESPKGASARRLGLDEGEFSRILSLAELSPKVEKFALKIGINDPKVINGIQRIERRGSQKQIDNLLHEIELNETLKKEGRGRPLRKIVQEALARLKSGTSKAPSKTKDKKLRQLSARKISISPEDDGGILLIETPREVMKIKLDKEMLKELLKNP